MYEEKVKILSADSKDYDLSAKGGPVGTSHKVRFNMNGEIFNVSVKEEQIKDFVGFVGKEGTLNFDLSSPKENLKLKINSFTV